MSKQFRKISTQPRRVDLLHNDNDTTVAILASLGFSTTMIMEQTGLTFCQVTYRLHKAGVRRIEYRNGTSPVAKAMLEANQKKARPFVMEHLQEHLSELYSER